MATPAPLILSRAFDAPRQMVFDVNTQPQHLARWLSPDGFESIHTNMVSRVGGQYHYGIQGPNGMQMWGKQEYLEIVPNQRVVYLQSFSDAEGRLGTHPMAPTWPKYMHVITTFADAPDGATLVTLSWVPHESDDVGHQTFEAARTGMEAGWSGTFAKLDAYLRELRS